MATSSPRRKRAGAQPRGTLFVQKVLDATLAQLAQVGFERLSIPEVAALAGVNKTSVYRRWPTKSDLVRETLATAMDHVSAAPDTGDLRGDLVGLARIVADFLKSPTGTGIIRVLLAEGANPELRALATSRYASREQLVPRASLMRALEKGELAHPADVPLVLFTLAGALMHRVFVEQDEVTDEFLERIVDLVLFGALHKPPRARR